MKHYYSCFEITNSPTADHSFSSDPSSDFDKLENLEGYDALLLHFATDSTSVVTEENFQHLIEAAVNEIREGNLNKLE